ncbi:MAG: TatD family hydrolase [Eubacteriales bacterium]|nr:TatD family hydrolase [Eubacteriales bacterium]
MIFDAHMHVFPDALAGKALPRMQAHAQIPYHTDGTLADTLQKMEQWGVERGLFLHIATRPGQQRNVNDFAASIQSDRVYCFGSVHPDDADALPEMERVKALGLHGLKFHFDYQHTMMDDAKMLPLFDLAQQLGLPITVHAGLDPYSPTLIHAPTAVIAKIAGQFPRLSIIAAHMGAMQRYEDALTYLVGLDNVYLDTSMSAVYCPPELFARILAAKGADRVLFGSDCPWDTAPRDLAFLQQAGLGAADLDRVTGGNLCALLGLG